MTTTLLKLSENDKRLIIVILLLAILIFVIAGYVGLFVKKIMSIQAKKADTMVHDVVKAGVITTPKGLCNFGMRKNWRVLFQQSWIPVCIMLFGTLMLLIYCLATNNWDVNVWDYQNEGFGTLFHIFDWAHIPTANFFGIQLMNAWPECISTPHLSGYAWGSYIFIPCMFVGGTWFLVCTQAYIARSFRIKKLSKTVFNKSLDDFNSNENVSNEIKPE